MIIVEKPGKTRLLLPTDFTSLLFVKSEEEIRPPRRDYMLRPHSEVEVMLSEQGKGEVNVR